MTAGIRLLADLAALGVTLQLHGDALRFRPRDKVTPELLQRLRTNKVELLAMLAGGSQDAHGDAGPVTSGPSVMPGDGPQPQDLPGGDRSGARDPQPQHMDGAPVGTGGRPGFLNPCPSDVAGGGSVALQPLGADGPQDDHGDAGQAQGDAGAADGPQDLAAVRQAMAEPAAPRTRPAVPVAVEWPAAAADFALLLAPDDLPPVPFRLNTWSEVRDGGKYLRWLQADILRGPGGPRAFYGALQTDLEDLQRFALQAADKRQQEGRPQR